MPAVPPSLPPAVAVPLPRWAFVGVAAATAAAFHLAHQPEGTVAILGFAAGLGSLAAVPPASARWSFYGGLALGLALYGPRLTFFVSIFGAAGLVLWLVLAFWVGLFLLLTHVCHGRLGAVWALALTPVIWTGLEYFRGELYYLRFSWLTMGAVLADGAGSVWLCRLGGYGVGFALLGLVSGCWLASRRHWRAAVMCWAGLGALLALGWRSAAAPSVRPGGAAAARLRVAGVQLEFPSAIEVVDALERLRARQPRTELFVLSEYTFNGPVPRRVRQWCRKRGAYLLAGGKQPGPDGAFFNTAFVVGPAGEDVFAQGKCVPIQFFQDGLPAPSQRVWDSPWGKLGVCICYDLSYTRITDALVRQGAAALLVPTMDVESWGAAQHQLHARVGPLRAAEHGVPVFRLASSGISQLVDARGRVAASAGFPGPGEMLAGELVLAGPGRRPPDRWLAPLCTGLTALIPVGLGALGLGKRRKLPDENAIAVAV